MNRGEGEFDTQARNAGIAVHYCSVGNSEISSVPFRSYRIKRLFRNYQERVFERKLHELLDNLDVDLVHSQIPNLINRQGSVVLEKLGKPWVFTLRGVIGNGGFNFPGLDEALRLVAQSEKARIACVSKAVYESMVRCEVSVADKSRVIYNGIDRNRFAPSQIERTSVRQKWLLPSTAIVFGTANRLVPLKRVDIAIAAFAQIAAANEDAYLVIAGDGPLLSELCDQVTNLGLTNRVRLVGFQEDMNNFLNGLDVFILTSETESFSNATLEAQAVHLPCIVTAVGGVPEVVGDAGILIEPNSVDALVSAMRSMLSAQQREIYAQRTRATAEKFDITKTAAQYAVLYDELLERSAMRS